MGDQYMSALDLAILLAESDPESEIDADQVESWGEWDLYEWLETAWGFTWDETAGAWVRIDGGK